MLSTPRRRRTAIYFLSLIVIFTLPLLVSYNSKTQLEAIREDGVLRILTRNSTSSWYRDHGKPAGFEYELAKAFADYLGVRLKTVVVDDIGGLIAGLRQRDAHMAASILTVTPERAREFDFSPAYLQAAASVVYRVKKGRKAPKKVADLYGKKIAVLPDSSHAELLRRYQLSHPELTWQEPENVSSLDLLEQVYNGDVDYSIADSVLFDAQHSYFPGLKRVLPLEQPQPVSWMLNRHHDNSLKEALDRFFAREYTQKLIVRLKKKYLEQDNKLNFFDTVTFKKDLKNRLPHYEQLFRIASQESGWDWKLLASVAYQESHWNPKAVSPTGVRGIMMLTRTTAKEVGVKDRRNPVQSIIGGARYLRKIEKRIPERIQEPDRTWFALASYNVGYGHLEDARILANRGGKNPDKWEDVRKFLPLLTKKKYYSTVKRGYARGYEPVRYVANIRKYLQLLSWEVQVEQLKQQEDLTAQPEASDNTPDTSQAVNQVPATL